MWICIICIFWSILVINGLTPNCTDSIVPESQEYISCGCDFYDLFCVEGYLIDVQYGRYAWWECGEQDVPERCCNSSPNQIKLCKNMTDQELSERSKDCDDSSTCTITHKPVDVSNNECDCSKGNCNKTPLSAIVWKCMEDPTITENTTEASPSTTAFPPSSAAPIPSTSSSESSEQDTSSYSSHTLSTKEMTTEMTKLTTREDSTTSFDIITDETTTYMYAGMTTVSSSESPSEITTAGDRTTANDETSTAESGGDQEGVDPIVYVVVGAVAGGGLIVLAVMCVCRSKRNSPPKTSETESESVNRKVSTSQNPLLHDNYDASVSHFMVDSVEDYAMVNKVKSPPCIQAGTQPDIQRVSSKPDLLPDTEVYYNLDPVHKSTAPSENEGVLENYYRVSMPTDPSMIQQAQRFESTGVTTNSIDEDGDMFGLDFGGEGTTDRDYDYISHNARIQQRGGDTAGSDDDYAVPDVPDTPGRPLQADSSANMEEGDDYDYAYGHMGTDGPIIRQGDQVISGASRDKIASDTIPASNYSVKGERVVANDTSSEAHVYAVSNKKKPPVDGAETVMKDNELYG